MFRARAKVVAGWPKVELLNKDSVFGRRWIADVPVSFKRDDKDGIHHIVVSFDTGSKGGAPPFMPDSWPIVTIHTVNAALSYSESGTVLKAAQKAMRNYRAAGGKR